jgi:hypothetical protein
MRTKKQVLALIAMTIVLTMLSTACSASAVWGG